MILRRAGRVVTPRVARDEHRDTGPVGPPGVSAAVDPAIGSEGKPLQDSPPVALIARVLLPSVLVRERAEPGLVWMRGDRHDSRDGIPGKLQHAVTRG